MGYGMHAAQCICQERFWYQTQVTDQHLDETLNLTSRNNATGNPT